MLGLIKAIWESKVKIEMRPFDLTGGLIIQLLIVYTAFKTNWLVNAWVAGSALIKHWF